MVVTPVNGHNRPRPPSPGAELYQELVDHFRFLLTTSSELPLWSLRDPLVSWSGGRRVVLEKKCLERQKAGWLDGCHGVMRKAVNAVNVVNSVQITIYPRRSEPFIGNQKQLFGFVFSCVKIVCWFDWIFWQMHRNSQLCQTTPYCFMINVMLLCNKIFSINSATAIIITSCLLWSSVFSYLCFTCLAQKLDNWKYTTRAPRFTAKSRDRHTTLLWSKSDATACCTQID